MRAKARASTGTSSDRKPGSQNGNWAIGSPPDTQETRRLMQDSQ